jgi:hypothetical protein
MNYVFEWMGDNPHVIFFGDIDLAMINEATERIYGDPRLDRMKYLVCNFDKVERFKGNPEKLKTIIELDRYFFPWNQHLKIAGVFNDQKIREIVLEYTELVKDSKWKLKIFSSLDDALVWCQE